MSKHQEEVDLNYEIFRKNREKIEREHPNSKYVLMRHGEFISFHQLFEDADKDGDNRFQDGLYSIQELGMDIVDLGFYSYA